MKIIEIFLDIIKKIFLIFLAVILIWILFIIGSFMMLPEGHCDDPKNAYDFECVD
jgi:hypothetical protein